MTDYRFGLGNQVYVFPPEIHVINDNFADVALNAARLPGADGGFDPLGGSRGPAEIGLVQLEFSITADWAKDTYAESDPALALQKARDAVRAMTQWGRMKLYKPVGSIERWCWAKVNSFNMPVNTAALQRITVQFQATLPYWFSQGTQGEDWGGFSWGDGTKWGGDVTPQAASGLSTSWTLNVNGNAETRPQITVAAGVGGMNDMRLQRLVNGYPVEEVSYTGALSNGDRLFIDCQNRRVLLNSGDAYNSNFDYSTPEWITLEPGANTLRLLTAQSGNSANVYVKYYEAYR